MTISKTKTTATMIIVLLISSMMLVAVVQAQLSHVGTSPTNVEGYPDLGQLPPGVTPQITYQTGAYMSFRPNPIGVGQSLLVNLWVSPGTYHAFYMADFKVDIIKPSGETETVGPFNSYTGDSTAWFEYVPDEVGTWQFKYTFPGTYIPAGQYWDLPGSETGGFIAQGKFYNLTQSIHYAPSETEWQNLTVQAELVSSWPYSSLPNDYWTRPVNVMWRDWGLMLGSYPFNSVYYYPGGRVLYASNYRFTAYVTAPNTAHVLRKQMNVGVIAGMEGGYTYDYSYSGSSGTPDIIFQGRCYDSLPKSFGDGTIANIYTCYDLRTGEIFWERDLGSYPTPAYIEYYHPGLAVIGGGGAGGALGAEAAVGWQISFIAISGGRLYKYNPATGAPTSNISLSPISSATYYAPSLALSVQDLGAAAVNETGGRYRLINWTTAGTTNTFADRVISNISWPMSGLGSGFSNVIDYEAGLLASCSWANPPGPQWCVGVELRVTDLKTGIDLWTYETNDTLSENAQSPSSFVFDRGKLAFGAHGRHWTCFDGRTGAKLWTSEQTEYPWGAWYPYNRASMDITEDLGAIITHTYEGVYAINWADGKILWHYTDENAVPFEGPYDATPFFTSVQLADGKVYAYNGEHTASFPRDRGWSIYCINATDGELLWKMKNPMTPGAIADGYLTASNPYDGYMYVFGRGPTATTVTAPDVAVPLGTAFTIKGTVLDMSPGQPGTPCVSKDSMTTQMEYLHLQMPIGGLWGNETVTGVPVFLTALGSDDSYYDLGTVMTNGYGGNFGLAWTPPKEDTYTIIASFAADDSYGSSTAYTTVTVGPAPTTPEIPPAIEPVDNTALLYGVLVAVIIAIVIGLVALLGVFRKH